MVHCHAGSVFDGYHDADGGALPADAWRSYDDCSRRMYAFRLIGMQRIVNKPAMRMRKFVVTPTVDGCNFGRRRENFVNATAGYGRSHRSDLLPSFSG